LRGGGEPLEAQRARRAAEVGPRKQSVLGNAKNNNEGRLILKETIKIKVGGGGKQKPCYTKNLKKSRASGRRFASFSCAKGEDTTNRSALSERRRRKKLFVRVGLK